MAARGRPGIRGTGRPAGSARGGRHRLGETRDHGERILDSWRHVTRMTRAPRGERLIAQAILFERASLPWKPESVDLDHQSCAGQ